ncbi:MAG: permease-like cell division protein FtsX [Firmicutes bacterium]|nr:permease-like cell division protein FtsX [Bacillota bacterium]
MRNLFKGRLSRRGFLCFLLFNIIVGIASFMGILTLSIKVSELTNSSIINILLVLTAALVYVGLLLLSLSFYARRLHDIGKSGWWSLLQIVPIAGVLLMFYLAIKSGVKVENRYGKQSSFGSKDLGLIFVFIVLGLFLLTFSVYEQKSDAMKLVEEGDRLLVNKDPYQALEKYQQAQTRWPFLRSDRYFNKQNALALNQLQKPAIIIFLQDQANQNEIDTLVSEVKQNRGVRRVKFISKEEALQIYKERNKNNPTLLGLATVNMLPASIEVYLSDASAKVKIAELAKNKPFVEEVTQF